ncbi:MAG: nitric oxide synthase oxygenase [Actinobacteria bacterium]|nr:nitric oxide synthase oxygenase [Actinomycetota bacterium]MBI3687787.1 nitric oxide synthase oxygenase [Actinomycetota bacterium]
MGRPRGRQRHTTAGTTNADRSAPPPAAPPQPAQPPAAPPRADSPLTPPPPLVVIPRTDRPRQCDAGDQSRLPTPLTWGADRRGSGTPVDFAAAAQFLRLYHAEQPAMIDLRHRLGQVRAEIERTGSYRHTSEELAFGAKLAWRNAARCIGRLYWRRLHVRDRRHLRDPAEIANEAAEHLQIATNGGRIRPIVTVFAPDTPDSAGPRIWNEQLVSYAGHRRRDGGVLGDPRTADLTELARRLGWTAPETSFDLLPLVIDGGDGRPRMFELPEEVVAEVPLSHPQHEWFGELGLRWYAVPVISAMCLDIGGICYPAAPFSRWHMGTEIGARGLADRDRYDLLPLVARRLGMDTSTERSLWRDRALIELTAAVLHSFDRAGVSMADHHTESRRFMAHLEQERQQGRPVSADWSWIVPPISGSATQVFHQHFDELDVRPAYVRHDDPPHRAGHGVPGAAGPPRASVGGGHRQ